MGARDADGLVISGTKRIPDREIEVERVRSGGPGGQHVNKVATKVVLRFSPGSSSAFSAEERERVLLAVASRLNAVGELVIQANEHRSAERNLDAARARLAALLRQALIRPKVRRATRPTRASGRRRLETKRRVADRKRERRDTPFD
jgi:ribosome-associated protein